MMRPDIEQSDVFVSWTSKDRELKNKVIKYLKSKKLKCLDADESCCGDFVEWSKEAAEVASVFVLILTGNTVDKIRKDKENSKPNYVLEEVHTALKEWGDDAINRIIVFCQNDEVYNCQELWEDLQGVSGGNLLRKGHSSVIYGTELTDDNKLEELSRKVTNLIIRRFIHKYNTAMSANYIKLVPFYKELQKSPDRQIPFDDLYVSRTITEIGANGEELAKLDSPAELAACGDILFLSGPGGSGKTQYLNQLFKSVDDDTVMISRPCFKISNSKESLFEDMYHYFYEKCGHKDFFSMENFRSLLSAKKLLLVLDGMDEIPTKEAVGNFLNKVGDFYEPDSESITLLFTGRNEKDAEYITFKRKTVRKFRLNQLSDDGIRELGNKLFIQFGNEDKGNEFYVKVKDLDDEIKSNPLLLSQLAIVYNDSGDVPQTIVGILDAVSAIMLNCDENKPIDVPQGWKKERIEDLSDLLAEFAAERYKCISQGNKTPTALKIFKKLLRSKYNDKSESHAKFLLKYIKSRAFYIEDNDGNGDFCHKMFSEYFTAVYYYKEAFDDCSDKYSKIEDRSVISELFGHYSDSYWAKVLQLFLMKADSCIDKETTDELYKLILSENKIEEYTLLFDCCRDLIVHKQEAQTVLVYDILQKSADGVYPPYGPLFWYVPEYGLYETALFAASCMKGNAKALALVRDVCYIYGQKNSIGEITDKLSGQELFDAASPELDGVRRALCEIFYLGDTKYEGGRDIYPRCFNVAETLSFRDYSYGLSGRMKTPFQDELGLYSHTSYNILNGGPTGLVSCPYDAAEMEKKLSGIESVKLRGLILSPTEKERFTFVNFTRINVQVLYLPENITDINERFYQYLPLVCDVRASKESVNYLFGDIKILLGDVELHFIFCNEFCGCRTIKSVVIAEGVWRIGAAAFDGCSSLQKIEIPEGVREIGTAAFRGCSSLREIEIPEGVREIGSSAFDGCSSLQKIEIPVGVKEIGAAAFDGCSSLQKIEIPEGVREIGTAAFRGCSSLREIEIPVGVEKIGISAFWGCSSLKEIEIPVGVKEIGNSAFKGCSNLKEIEIPVGVKEIREFAFSGCSSLEKIEIPGGVREIGSSAFGGCSSLKKITLPDYFELIKDVLGLDGDVYIERVSGNSSDMIIIKDGTEEILEEMFKDSLACQFVIPSSVKKIGARAFLGSSRLKTIEIPRGVRVIGESAFEGCKSLQKIEIPEGVEEIGDFAFSGCSSLQKIEIPEGVREIGDGAFRGCSSLQEITIPEGVRVRVIGSFAFKGCSSLQKIEIPGGVRWIGWSAFEGCRSLQYIKIPESVEAIFSYAFKDCNNLKEIKIPEGVKKMGKSVFVGCDNLKKIMLSDVNSIEETLDFVCIESGSRSFSEKIVIKDGTEEILEGMFQDSLACQFVIPSSVKKIGARAFLRCRRLKTIKIPGGVRGIGEYAFAGCSSLQEIEIPGGVRWIGKSAFRDCSSLQEIEIPEGVGKIEEFVFNDCSSLKEVKIPGGVRWIGESAFGGCSSLEKIEIPEGVREIEMLTFSNCSSLKEVKIPEGVEKIFWKAFNGCSSLKKIEIPEGVKEIGEAAFCGCSSLKKIEVPEGVRVIGDLVFEGCSSLKEIVIPQSVVHIGDDAFKDCTGLESVTIGINFKNDIQRIFGEIDSKIIQFI